MRLFGNKRRFWCLVLLLGGAALIVVLLLLESPRAELLTQPPELRRSRLAFLGRWSGPVRNTWQKLQLRWFRPPRNVFIVAQVFEMDRLLSMTNSFWPAPELSSDNGVQVWILTSNQISAVGVRVALTGISASSMVATRDGMPVTMSIGQRFVTEHVRVPLANIRLHFLPRTRGESVELASFMTISELTRLTNVAVGARVRIPSGQSMLLLTTNHAIGRQQIGLLVSPVVR